MSIEFTAGLGFSWTTENGDLIEVAYPFPEPKERIPKDENQVYVLWAEQHKESDVIPVCVDKVSCGWLFTVSAMTSTEVESENQYFRIAAWAVALYLIDKHRKEIECKCASSTNYAVSFSDFIDDDLSILTFYKPRLAESIANKPNAIIPQLVRQGLLPYSDARIKGVSSPSYVSPGSKLNITSDIKIEQFHDFHVDLLVNHILLIQSAVFKFYLYYQIVESMMETVLASVCEDTISKIAVSSGDPTMSYDILEKHKEKTGEKYRISQVFNNFVTAPISNMEVLGDECIRFLLSIDSTIDEAKLREKKNAALHFYAVRNQLIHNFRRVGTNNSHIESIVKELDVLVPDLLCKFEKKNLSAMAGAVN